MISKYTSPMDGMGIGSDVDIVNTTLHITSPENWLPGCPPIHNAGLEAGRFDLRGWKTSGVEKASGQIITTCSRRLVTLNGGLVRESPQNPLNSGLRILLICPDAQLSYI